MRDVAVQFKKAGVADAALLKELWVRTFEEAYVETHTTQNIRAYCDLHYTLEKAQETLSDAQTDCMFIHRDNQYAGLLVVTHHECPAGPLDGGSSELKQIYILKEHYGAGFGKLLYQKALALISEKKRKWVWLIVSDLNVRAQTFYKKAGLKSVGAGPVLTVGSDSLSSTIMAGRI